MLAHFTWLAFVPLGVISGAAATVPDKGKPNGQDAVLHQTASFELLGQSGGPSNAVATYRGFALLGSGRNVAIFDENADLAGQPLWSVPLDGTVRDLTVGSETAYALVEGNRLHVIDVAGLPGAPVVLGRLDAPAEMEGQIEQVLANGQFLYTTGPMGLGVINLSDPRQPSWVRVVEDVGGVSLPVVEGGHLFAASNTDLLVFDISQPALPTVAARTSVVPEGYLTGLDLDGGYAVLSTWWYVERRSSAMNATASAPDDPPEGGQHDSEANAPDPAIPTTAALIILDVRNPLAPVEVGRLDLSGSVETVWRLVADSGFAYLLASHYAGPRVTYGVAGSLMVADFRSPDAISLVGDFDWHSDVGADIALSGPRAFVAESYGGLRVLSLVDQSAPALSGSYDTPFVPRAVAAAADQAVLGDHGIGGLWIEDTRAPADVRVRAVVPDLDSCLADCDIAFVDSGLAVVADFNRGALVLDARAPTTPILSAPLTGAGGAVAVDTSGPNPVVVSEPSHDSPSSQLHILEARSPDTARILGTVELPGRAADVAYANGAAFATTSSGLVVVDVGDAEHPVVIAQQAVGGSQPRVAASGDHVYVVQGDGVIHVLDISQPSAPREVGWLDKAREDAVRPNQVLSVEAVSGTLYVQHHQWLQAVDVSDPRRPREIAWTNAWGASLVDMDAADGRLYLATQSDGLLIAALRRAAAPVATVFLPSLTTVR